MYIFDIRTVRRFESNDIVKYLLFILFFTLCGILSQAQEKITPYREIVVAKAGSADFRSIAQAIQSTRDLGPGFVRITIKKGVYEEKIVIPDWKTRIILSGEDREETIIVNSDFSGKHNPLTGVKFFTFNSYTMLVAGDDFIAENLTVKNASCGEGQAVALHVSGSRAIFRNCNIVGCQDTVYASREGSLQYYEDCYIEGTTDFIFGEATAVFRNCTIKSTRNSYITAAATPRGQEFGFVFMECALEAAPGVGAVFLGRPWRPYARTVFLSCTLGPHIVPEGWDPWTGDKMFPAKEKTAFYAEYGSVGEGSDVSQRVAWSHQLHKRQARIYTLKNILKSTKEAGPWYDRIPD